MLLNEITTSDDRKIQKINKVLQETYGFTLVSEIKTGTLNTLYTKIADDLYDLKLDLSTAKDSAYMQKVLVLEGLKILIAKNNKRLEEAAVLAGKGGRAFTRILSELTKFIDKVCNMGDDYEEAIKDAMKHYRSSIYRFPDEVVEYELRKATVDDCTDTVIGEVYETVESDCCDKCDCDPCECKKVNEDKGCDKCDCDPCECEKVEEAIETEEQSHLYGRDEWYKNDPKELMSHIYWLKDKLPPSDPEKYEAEWQKIKAQLEAKHPAPVDEGGDRHAEHDWVKGMKQDAGMDSEPGYADSGTDGLSLLDPAETQQDDADDFFSYQAKKTNKKRTEMKEGYVKELRKLLEAETDQAESLIAAKSFSQELQDMVEKLGRLVNENLPAVSEQMRDAYGSDVATGFEDLVSGTLNAVMDSLRNSKQDIDNSVSTIADGGAPEAGSDMENYSDEELGGEFDDAELDLDSDVELDLGDDELGDDFGGDDAVAGLEDEPLGRAKKEALVIIGKKLVETKAKLARIKAKASQ